MFTDFNDEPGLQCSSMANVSFNRDDVSVLSPHGTLLQDDDGLSVDNEMYSLDEKVSEQ